MKKIYLSFSEFAMMLHVLILIWIFFIIIGYLEFNSIIFLLIAPIALLCFFRYYKFISKHLIGTSIYNPLGYIELHIDDKHNGRKRDFFSYAAVLILQAAAENKNVLIDTWIIDEEKAVSLFKEAVEVKKVPPLQFVSNLLSKIKYLGFKKIKKPTYRFIIHINLLDVDAFERLEKHAGAKIKEVKYI